MKSVVVSILSLVICVGCSASWLVLAGSTDNARPLKPIVLIPGYHANRLEAELDRQEVKYEYCQRKTDGYFDLWLNADDYDADLVNCFMDNMSLGYNSSARTSSDQEGVSIRVQFNKTEPLEYSSRDKNLEGSPLFNILVQRLVDLGYERDKNILGAAYDWRKAPNELTQYLIDLTKLIEQAYCNNNRQPAVIICHSYGCVISLYFLSSQSKTWKHKYVSSMISLSGAYGGSRGAAITYVAGTQGDIPTLPNLKRTDVITWPSTAFLLASNQAFPGNQVLVKDIKDEFTTNDYQKLFEKIQNPVAYQQYLDTKDIVDITEPPGVEVYCFHGYNIPTPEQIIYETKEIGKYFNTDGTILFGDGDGVINLQSLKVCLDWTSKQADPVHYRNFSSVKHDDTRTDENVFRYIKEALHK